MRILIGALLLLAATVVAPWLRGGWAAGRIVALCFAPGAAILAWLAPSLSRTPLLALAGVLLTSAVATPLTLLGGMYLLGGVGEGLVAGAIAWGALLAAGLLRRRWSSPHPLPKADLLWVTAAVGWIALPLLLNPVLRHHSDAFTHIAITREILTHDVPWTDPRFAGQPLRYFWFFNLWAAGFSARGGIPIPWSLTLVNLTALTAFAAAMVAVVRHFFASGRHRTWALLLILGGLNPLGVFGIATHLAAGLFGEWRGIPVIFDLFRRLHFLDSEVVFTLTPRWAYNVSWVTKFLVITPFGIGMAGAVFSALVLWEACRRRKVTGRTLLLLSIGVAAVTFHHLIAAGFVGAALAGGLLWSILARRSPFSMTDTLRLAAAAGLAVLITFPYYATILLGRELGIDAGGYGLGFDPRWLITLLTSVGPLILLLWFGRETLRERLGPAMPVFAGTVLCGILMMACVRLPTVNESKMFILFYCLAAPYAAAGAVELSRRWAVRPHLRAVGLVLVASAVLVPVMIWLGFLAQPPPKLPAGVDAAGAWIREHTRRDAVLIEPRESTLLLNRGEREQFVGQERFITECGYPRREMNARLALIDHLYATGDLTADEVAQLRSLGRPVYLFWRRCDAEPSPEHFRLFFAEGSVALYRLRTAATALRKIATPSAS